MPLHRSLVSFPATLQLSLLPPPFSTENRFFLYFLHLELEGPTLLFPSRRTAWYFPFVLPNCGRKPALSSPCSRCLSCGSTFYRISVYVPLSHALSFGNIFRSSCDEALAIKELHRRDRLQVRLTGALCFRYPFIALFETALHMICPLERLDSTPSASFSFLPPFTHGVETFYLKAIEMGLSSRADRFAPPAPHCSAIFPPLLFSLKKFFPPPVQRVIGMVLFSCNRFLFLILPRRDHYSVAVLLSKWRI